MKVNQIFIFNLRSKYLKFLLICFLLLFGFTTQSDEGNTISSSYIILNSYVNSQLQIRNDQDLKKDTFNKEYYVSHVKKQAEIELIDEVDKFIKSKFPTSKLSAFHLVKKCLKYDIDIVFSLSQGIVESQLGTDGSARKTNSVWNVGTYDNGKVLYKYKHPNQSIEPYLILLKENYLIKVTPRGDTLFKDINSLIKDKGFYNKNGHRFAANKDYEDMIRKTMVLINSKTSITMYQDLIKQDDKMILKVFAPIKQINKSKEKS